MFRRNTLKKNSDKLKRTLSDTSSSIRSRGSLKRSFSNSLQRENSKSSRNEFTMEKLSIEMTHLIVKRCSDEIRLRGLHEVDIFKPQNIGDSTEEATYLINFLLRDNRIDYETELASADIHNVVSTLKWALRHCEEIIVPYQYYEEFVKFDQEYDFDPNKGSFTQFLQYIPLPNRNVLVEVFQLCADVTANSDINKMSAQKIVKCLALCIIRDDKQAFASFDDAYKEYTSSANACLHLFLAYLRESSLEKELPPRLTMLLDNYDDIRKVSTAPIFVSTEDDFKAYQQTVASSSNERRASMLRVTRSVPRHTPGEQRKSVYDLLPQMMNNIKRETIVSSSSMMTMEQRRTADHIWEEVQRDGFATLSDNFKTRFALKDEYGTLIAEQQDALQGDSDVLQELFQNNNGNNIFNVQITKTFAEEAEDEDEASWTPLKRATLEPNAFRPKTLVWDEFKQNGFRNSFDNISQDLSLSETLLTPSLSDSCADFLDEDKIKSKKQLRKQRRRSTTNIDSSDSDKDPSKGVATLRRRRPQPKNAKRTSSFVSRDVIHDKDILERLQLEEWCLLDPQKEITTHLAIETIDDIFPYIWMEITTESTDGYWGDWVFIEPRKDLNYECEWILIEEKEQVFAAREAAMEERFAKALDKSNNWNLSWLKKNGSVRSSEGSLSRRSETEHLVRHTKTLSRGNKKPKQKRRDLTRQISAPIPVIPRAYAVAPWDQQTHNVEQVDSTARTYQNYI
ncbi:1430_t:CDS:2 [Paraglomus brasilianum]|uniref:1430_t:CDS:1 n=1 Tax=Paraglomus brasilianum TaxID=144538 RepID=A0A9N9G657_9GLOM|nr:1430_t:CDS:2 [Paraglomus brasilianum]